MIIKMIKVCVLGAFSNNQGLSLNTVLIVKHEQDTLAIQTSMDVSTQ